jgi:trehalose utilization protein
LSNKLYDCIRQACTRRDRTLINGMRFRLFLALIAFAVTTNAEPIKVLVWDERQPRQAEAYDNFLGNEIAEQLLAGSEDFEVRSVALEDEDQGVSDENLDWADVVIWWGHVRHSDLTEENANRVLNRVLEGKLDLVVLHSAHWARPFVYAMNWRAREDAIAHFAEAEPGKIVKFDFVDPPKERTVPAHGSALTPAYFAYKRGGAYQGIVYLPWCCFPDYRADGEPSTIKVAMPDHPIAKGLAGTFQVKQTEMYDEPFHVPDPDEVIFEETWELGERFRAGMVWEIGEGKVFYFRPGHETYPAFKQPEVIQVLANAARWLGSD